MRKNKPHVDIFIGALINFRILPKEYKIDQFRYKPDLDFFHKMEIGRLVSKSSVDQYEILFNKYVERYSLFIHLYKQTSLDIVIGDYYVYDRFASLVNKFFKALYQYEEEHKNS